MDPLPRPLSVHAEVVVFDFRLFDSVLRLPLLELQLHGILVTGSRAHPLCPQGTEGQDRVGVRDVADT